MREHHATPENRDRVRVRRQSLPCHVASRRITKQRRPRLRVLVCCSRTKANDVQAGEQENCAENHDVAEPECDLSSSSSHIAIVSAGPPVSGLVRKTKGTDESNTRLSH